MSAARGCLPSPVLCTPESHIGVFVAFVGLAVPAPCKSTHGTYVYMRSMETLPPSYNCQCEPSPVSGGLSKTKDPVTLTQCRRNAICGSVWHWWLSSATTSLCMSSGSGCHCRCCECSREAGGLGTIRFTCTDTHEQHTRPDNTRTGVGRTRKPGYVGQTREPG